MAPLIIMNENGYINATKICNGAMSSAREKLIKMKDDKIDTLLEKNIIKEK
jgi:hypothetical protein